MTYKELYLKEHPEMSANVDFASMPCPEPLRGGKCPHGFRERAGKQGCRDCWDQEIPETCSCYDAESERCNGTKERDECTCGGDESKCDFYSHKRVRASAQMAEKGLKTGILEPKLNLDKKVADLQMKIYEELGITGVAAKYLEINEKAHKPEIKIGDTKVRKFGEAKTGMFIKDSGTRREFSTGAVRDIQEGKGRCDLMPLDVVGHLLFDDPFIFQVHEFTKDGDPEHLICALAVAAHGNGYPWDQLADMLLDVSMHFEAGAKKYGEHNWRRGIPTKCYIDSAVRHYLKMCRGDKDEAHDRAFVWNILCCIWTCKHKPELNDYLKKEE